MGVERGLCTQSEVPFNGLIVQTGNDHAYTSSTLGAVVLDAKTGKVLHTTAQSIPVKTVGTAMSSDGMVFFAEATGTLYGFMQP